MQKHTPDSFKNHGAIAALLLIVLLAAALRLTDLDRKPMHGDEANQAVKTGELINAGRYRYDPIDHHGPTLYYAAFVATWLSGQHHFSETQETTLRLVPALFGIALVFILWPIRKTLGTPALLTFALLITISPAFVYYSRYFIQEMLLVFFTAANVLYRSVTIDNMTCCIDSFSLLPILC